MDIFQIVKRPLVTEKGTHQAQQSHAATGTMPARGGSYAFEVDRGASKPMIKLAIEKIYSVKVQSVRTYNRRGKKRRYRSKIGTTRSAKKAVVVLYGDWNISLFCG